MISTQISSVKLSAAFDEQFAADNQTSDAAKN